MGKPINYSKLKKEYVTSNISIYALACKHKVSASTVRRKAIADGWGEAKAKYDQKSTEKLVETANGEWDKAKKQMIDLFYKLMEQYATDPDSCPEKYSALIRSAKDLRDMGVFGMTMSEKKIMAEIEKLKKDIADDGSRDVTIRLISEEQDEYGD